MHGAPPERHNVKQTRSALVWGLILPLLMLLLAPFTYGFSVLAYLMLFTLQFARIRRNERRRGRSGAEASLLAWHIMLAKYAQAQGVLLYHWRRVTGRQSTLIEYKGTASGGGTHA